MRIEAIKHRDLVLFTSNFALTNKSRRIWSKYAKHFVWVNYCKISRGLDYVPSFTAPFTMILILEFLVKRTTV